MLFLFLSLFASPTVEGVAFFEGPLDAALARAAETDRPVFIDFYADW